MSSKALVFLLLLVVSPLSFSCGEVKEGKRILPLYPVVGIDKEELSKVLGLIFDEIGSKNIFNIAVHDDTCIRINTGRVSGKLNGTGTLYTVEKVRGKWVVTNESNWIS